MKALITTLLILSSIPVLAQTASPTPSPGWFPTVSDTGVRVWTRDGSMLTNVSATGTSTGPIIQPPGTSNSLPTISTTNLLVNGQTVQGANPSFNDLTNGAVSSQAILPYNPPKTYLIFDGDSISANANSYVYWLTNVFGWNNFAFITNSAVSGQGLSALTNKWALSLTNYAPGSGTNAIFSVWIGANDYTETLLTVTPAQYCLQLSNYWGWIHSAGMKIVAFTITPRKFYNGMTDASKTNLYIINDFIRRCGIPDYVIDTAAMFPNNLDTFYYSDGTHPTTNTHYLIAQEWNSVLRSTQNKFTRQFSPPIGTNSGDFFSPSGALIKKMNANGVADVTLGGQYVQGVNYSHMIPGAPPVLDALVARYRASSYVTNGATPTLTNDYPTLGFPSLTNLAVAGTRPAVLQNQVSGFTTLAHTNGTWLEWRDSYTVQPPLTVSILLRQDDVSSVATRYFFEFGTNITTGNYLGFWKNSNIGSWGVAGSTTSAGNITPPWIPYTLTWDGVNCTTYTNGVQAGTHTSSSISISSFELANFFGGSITTGHTFEWPEIFVWTNVLNSSQIAQMQDYWVGNYLAPSNCAPSGYYFASNSVASWPAMPHFPGESYFGNSNGVVYLLTSTPGSLGWSATNKIAP